MVREKRGRAGIKLLLLACMVGLAWAVVVGGVGVAADTGGDGAHEPEVQNVTIDEELEGASEQTEVVVRLQDTEFESVAQAQAHAEQTRQPVEQLAASESGVRIENRFWITNAVLLTVDTEEVPFERIAELENVEALHANFEVETEEARIDPGDRTTPFPATGDASEDSTDATYGLEQINATEAWDEYDTKGEGIRVAVIDTGVDADHDDINLYTEDESDETYPGGWAEFDNTGEKVEGSTPHDDDSHGTHVSGTVAGGDAGGQHIGVAPDVELIHGMGLPDGSGSFAQMTGAIEWAVENDADVVSMSFGADGYYTMFTDPIRNAEDAGVVAVASVGNTGEGDSTTPGNEYDSLSAGATDSDLDTPAYSGGDLIDTEDAWGDDAPDDWPDEYIVPSVTAPGVQVESAEPGGGYRTASGTSMAAPHVAGAVALIQSATDERKSSDEMKEALEETAWKPDDWDEDDAEESIDGQDTRYGHGIIDVPAAIDYLQDEDDGTAEFEVTDATLDEETILEGDLAEANATIENVGDAEGDFEAEFVLIDEDGESEVIDTEPVTLGPDESETVTLDDTVDDAGTYDAEVSDEPAGELTVDQPATFEVIDADLDEETILEGDSVNVTGDVENTGDRDGTHTAELLVDGDVEDTEDVDVDAGETEPVEFEEQFDDAGEYEIAIDDADAGDLTVETPEPEFDVIDAELNRTTILEGEYVEVTGDVENTGDADGTYTAELLVDDEVVDTEDVTVDAGETEPVEFDEQFDDAGEYEIAIDDEDAGDLTVEQPATFDVIDADLDEETILEGDSVNVTGDVENTGDRDGTHTAELLVDGDVADTENVTVDAGETEPVEFDEQFDEPGEYEIAIDDEDAGDLTVEEQESEFEVSDAYLVEETILEGELAEANATVENVGDAEGDFEAELVLTDEDGEDEVIDTEPVTLGPDESETVTLGDTVEDAGTYDAEVSDDPAGELTVEQPAIFDLSDGDLSDEETEVGESVNVTATVANEGDRDGTFEAELVVDGSVEDTTEEDVDAGASESIAFTYSPGEAGDYEIDVAGDDGDGERTDTEAGTLTALEPAEFEVLDPDLEEETIQEGETAAATATVENVGEVEGTFTLELTADDGSGSEVRNETDVTLAGGESTDERLEDTFEDEGEYEIEIGGEDAGTLTVEAPDPAEFETSNVTLSEETILEGESVNVTATVENLGDETGDHTAVLYVDDEEQQTETETIEGGESETVSFTEPFEDAGEYDVRVDDADSDTLTVEQPATFDVTDGDLNETTILEGEYVEVTADVENTGDRDGTHTAELLVDGGVVDTEDVDVDAGETEPVSFEERFDDAGEYEIKIDDADAGDLTVEESESEFEVTDAYLQDETILEGDLAEANATVENVGDAEGDFEAELVLVDEGGEDEVIDTEPVTLGPDESETVTLGNTVEDAGTYDAEVSDEPAGELTVEQPATFDVTDADLNESTILEGEFVEVTGDVENTGDRDGTYTAELLVDGEVTDTEDVDVDAGETEPVAFDEQFDDAGEYEIAIDDADAGDLTVDEPESEFDVTDADLNESTILEGEYVEVSGDVENVGDADGTYTAELLVDGEVTDTEDVDVDAGETEPVAFDEQFDDAGEYEIAIDDADAGELTVEQPATFDVIDAALDEETILAGESVNVTATVENEGDREGTFEAELLVDGTVEQTENVTVEADSTEPVSFDEQFDDAGEYDVAVNDADAGTLTVEDAEAEFEVTDASLIEEVILEGDLAEANATVENVGDAEGDFEVEFVLEDGAGDADVIDTEPVTLGAGESETVTLGDTIEDAGTYDAEVSDEPAGELTVEQPATFDVTDADLDDDRIFTDESVNVTGTVENTGDRDGTFTAGLLVDDEVVDTRDVTVAGGESEQVSFEESFDEGGEYGIAVNDTDAGTLTVQERGQGFNGPNPHLSETTVSEGETTNVTTEVENVGDTTHEGTVTVSVGDEVVENLTLSLDPDESETVTVPIDTLELEIGPGDHDVVVSVDDEQETNTLSVEHSVVTYADDDGVVRYGGVQAATQDWQNGEIEGSLLREVLLAWHSGEPVF